MRKMIFLLTILLIVFSCKPVDKEVEKQSLLKTDKDFAALSLQKGIYKAYSSYLEENATIEKENGEKTEGKKSILKSMSKFPKNLILSWEPTFVKILIPNNLGLTMGKYILNAKETDTIRCISKGKYIDLWKKKGPGKWKLYYDAGMSCGE